MSFEEGSGDWMNPPPPGTADDQPEKYAANQDRYEHRDRRHSQSPIKSIEDANVVTTQRSRSRSNERYPKHSRDRRRRSRSREYRRRRSRSRSGSRKRHDKRYSHKYRKYSRSRSRSRSRRHRRSYTRSQSPSPHKRRSRSRSWSSSSNSDKESYSRRHRMEVLKNQEYTRKVYSKRTEEVEEEEEIEPVQENTFKNDGSFLEMFKKMQEQQASVVKTEEPEPSVSEPKKPAPLFGKRRGGRVLKTGMVQKLKNPNELEDEPKDAWSVYMKEVRKYKEACCDDDSKTRPLVK